jgi:hypothetical protein
MSSSGQRWMQQGFKPPELLHRTKGMDGPSLPDPMPPNSLLRWMQSGLIILASMAARCAF